MQHYNKAVVAVIATVLIIADQQFNLPLGVSKEVLTSIIAAIGAFGVYQVRNR